MYLVEENGEKKDSDLTVGKIIVVLWEETRGGKYDKTKLKLIFLKKI